MRTVSDIDDLLDELDEHEADALEAQDLDFKEWSMRSIADSVDKVVEMAVCMANGGGGTVVFGVRDRIVGREEAIIGVPDEVDVNLLKRAVYDRTEPKITPVFERLAVDEGTGRLVIMQIHPGMPPYTDTSGRGTMRVGKDCVPLTGSLRRKIAVETRDMDFTAATVDGAIDELVSQVALEELRAVLVREHAANELTELGDADLLRKLEVVRNGMLTRAGLLLVGSPRAIRQHVPGYGWTFLRMRDETRYEDRLDGHEPIVVAVQRVMDRLMANNPLTTVEEGLFHFEYRMYPEIALREALMNAFSHADFRLGAPIMVKHFANSIEISNPGGMVGGVSPQNILHHTPMARNPLLVDALVKVRLVNRSNLGVPRMFKALLAQGKEPPIIEESGDSVKVSFLASSFSVPFRVFIEEEHQQGRSLSVDHLLVLQYLIRHAEIDTSEAARICQRTETQAREVLSEMELKFEYLERGGTGRGTYWRLSPATHERLSARGDVDRRRRISWETAKTRVLDVLKQRAKHGEGLANRQIRAISSLDRQQVTRLMSELRDEGHARLEGRGAGARWMFDRN